MYRGRLIQSFIAVIHRLDTATTEAASGYDPDFRSTKHTYPGGIGVRESSRRELAAIELRCQVEIGRWEAQRQMATGNSPDTAITLVFHFSELEAKGLVHAATGDPLIRVGDRVSAIKRVRDGKLVQAVRGPQNLYATEVQPAAYGLGQERNLLLVTLGERSQGMTAGAG